MDKHLSLKSSLHEPVWPLGLLPQEISAVLNLRQAFRGQQVFNWLVRGTNHFSEMTNLPSEVRAQLAASYPEGIYSSRIDASFSDLDGTKKIKIRLHDGAAIEAVLLHDNEDRFTACLSSQVGCAMGCTFCKTATLGWQRNLKAHEIIEQFYLLGQTSTKISNVVFMGMGEPLLNLPEVRKALSFLTLESGLNISRRKITLSTCGIVPGILDLADNGPQVRLAVSLTVADNNIRSRIMPVTKQYSLAKLQEALIYFQEKTGDRITIEAAIIKGINTDRNSIRQMAEWFAPLHVQVNVIPWNPVSGLAFEEPSWNEFQQVVGFLHDLGINAVPRTRKGTSVAAACGQLGETLEP